MRYFFSKSNVCNHYIPQKVLDISEIDNKIVLKFELKVEWFDMRLEYNNLKNKDSLNTLSFDEKFQIWVPYIIFNNTDDNNAIEIGRANKQFKLEGLDKTNIFVTRHGNLVRSDLSQVDEIDIFEGIENKLTLSVSFSKEFHCIYKLHYFPFDTQVCPVFHLLKLSRLILRFATFT